MVSVLRCDARLPPLDAPAVHVRKNTAKEEVYETKAHNLGVDDVCDGTRESVEILVVDADVLV